MAHPLIFSAHVSLQFHCVGSCIVVFCVLGNDFGGLWSQLRSGHYLGYVLYLNFIGGIKAVSSSKWSLFECGHMYRSNVKVHSE